MHTVFSQHLFLQIQEYGWCSINLNSLSLFIWYMISIQYEKPYYCIILCQNKIDRNLWHITVYKFLVVALCPLIWLCWSWSCHPQIPIFALVLDFGGLLNLIKIKGWPQEATTMRLSQLCWLNEAATIRMATIFLNNEANSSCLNKAIIEATSRICPHYAEHFSITKTGSWRVLDLYYYIL